MTGTAKTDALRRAHLAPASEVVRPMRGDQTPDAERWGDQGPEDER